MEYVRLALNLFIKGKGPYIPHLKGDYILQGKGAIHSTLERGLHYPRERSHIFHMGKETIFFMGQGPYIPHGKGDYIL